MTTLVTSLIGAAPITTAVGPTMGSINSYNASTGALAAPLPALASLNAGANCVVEKFGSDGTLNAVTFTANTGDTFDDSTTSFSLVTPGEKRTLQVISIAGTKYWKIIDGFTHKHGLAAITSEFALTNSSAASTIATFTLPAASLFAGSSYRILLNGTIQNQATSGTLTFTPFIQGTALAQTAVMATQTSANAASPFRLEYAFTVRTTGATGTAIAKPYGIVNLATSGVVYLTSTSTATTTINTTSSAGSNVLSVQAQWATASATNSLLVETATIERIV